MKRRLPATACHAITVQGSGSKPDKGSRAHDSRQNANFLPTPRPRSEAKKDEIGGTYLLQGPLGRSKPDLPTYWVGCLLGAGTTLPLW